MALPASSRWSDGHRPLLTDDALAPRARAVFDDIRSTRRSDDINNFWRALAYGPESLEATWAGLKTVLASGALDAVTNELVYTAVSTANGRDYWIHSHSASARAKGMIPDMHAEVVAVIGMAIQTNGLVKRPGVSADDHFFSEASGLK